MRSWLRPLLACFALALSTLGATACGATSRSSSLPVRDGDGDIDSLGLGRYDGDSDAVPTFGQAASAVDHQAVVALIRRYYKVAADGDGAMACSMLDTLVAEALVEEHERDRGPPSLRGNTCPQAAAKVFEQRHRELAEDVAGLQVAWVRVKGNRGVTLVRFAANRERLVRVHRAGVVWQMNALLDSGPL